jgi:hypothetical protein
MESCCTGYLEHPFKNLAVSISLIFLSPVKYMELLGKLSQTLAGLRTDIPSSQHKTQPASSSSAFVAVSLICIVYERSVTVSASRALSSGQSCYLIATSDLQLH